jgi:hypothetical protein
MELPFTRAEFLAVFAACNEAVWPLQIAALGLPADWALFIAFFARLAAKAREAAA